MAIRPADRVRTCTAAVALAAAVFAGGCATSSAYRAGQRAETAQDFDRAVADYTTAVRKNPGDRTAQLALDRARVRASQDHYYRGRRLQATEHYEEALAEFQVASELNPTADDVQVALRETRQKLRTRLAVSREGKTELQALIERSRDLAPAGLELPEGVKLPDSLVFSNAGSTMVFRAIGRWTDLNVIFDPGSGTRRSRSICATSRFRMHSRL